MTVPVPVSKWKWFGKPGHFVCAHQCRFHLCTQVGAFLVSTVGEYIPSEFRSDILTEEEWLSANYPGADIGYKRKYETMVFRCTGGICDCGCGVPKIDLGEIDMAGCNDAGTATANHNKLCRKYAKALTSAISKARGV